MKYFTVSLTKEDSLVIKGIAIIAIILHNYFHLFNGIVRENEFGYAPDNFMQLWSSLQDSFLYFIANFISMYGHYGVVAFFFVSGYGLTKKYKDRELERDFILKNAIKLWKLFVPILICFICLEIVKAFIVDDFITAYKHIYVVLCKSLSRILFISNFSEETVFWISGPWWFFSAIFQMYVLYKFVISKISSTVWLSAIALLMIVLQLLCYLNNPNISIIRYNSPAWIPAFILGVIFARHEIKIPMYWILSLIVTCFIVDVSFYTWILGYSLFVVLFLFLLKLIKDKTLLRKSLIKIGELSSFLFVTNTFVRTLVYRFICHPYQEQQIYFVVLSSILYLIFCFIIARLYKKLNLYFFMQVCKL